MKKAVDKVHGRNEVQAKDELLANNTFKLSKLRHGYRVIGDVGQLFLGRRIFVFELSGNPNAGTKEKV